MGRVEASHPGARGLKPALRPSGLSAALWQFTYQPSPTMTNSITLVGRAARDPEVHYFESGTMVTKLTLAVNRRSRGDEPDLFNLEIWGKQAQIAADYIRKGHLIGIIGGLRLDRCADRASGEERTTPVVLVDRLELLDEASKKAEQK